MRRCKETRRWRQWRRGAFFFAAFVGVCALPAWPAEYETALSVSSIQLEAFIDPGIPPYTMDEGAKALIQETKKIVSQGDGSDTLSHILVYVAQGFTRIFKNLTIHFLAHGSAFAAKALAEGTADLGPMSRVMTPAEVTRFQARWGYAPTRVKICNDAVAVYVHRKNPLAGLPFSTLARIFAEQPAGSQITKWGQLSLAGHWRNRPIVLYGRHSSSGTHAVFRKRVLKGLPYRSDIREMPGNQAVVQGVAGGLLNKPNGIGYASIAYDTEEVRPLQVAKDDQAPIIDPNYYNLQKGAYPLQRAMYVYINKRPGKAPEEVVLQFLRYTLSRNGQLLLAKGGFVPLHADEVDRQLRKVTPPEQPMQHKSLDSDL